MFRIKALLQEVRGSWVLPCGGSEAGVGLQGVGTGEVSLFLQ